MHEAAAQGLERARARTLALTDLDEHELTTQHSPLMSPLVWDLAHIGQQEDLWLLRDGDAAREGILPRAVDRLYDAFQYGRAERIDLPLLDPARARRFIADVRDRAFDRLAEAEDLFAFVMVEQHEQQHIETMLATHQLRQGEPLLGRGAALPAGRSVPLDAVLIPAGPFLLGVDASDEPFALDNERAAHLVDLPAFRIGRLPVTNAQWQAFIDDGGYKRSESGRRAVGSTASTPVWIVQSSGRPTVLGGGSALSSRSRPTNPSSTSATSRPRRTRGGQVHDCPPNRNGRRRASGMRPPNADAAGLGVIPKSLRHSPTSAVRRCARHP